LQSVIEERERYGIVAADAKTDAGGRPRSEGVRFVPDSPLEQRGFELQVPP
jgi:hypothetical protein